jgi:hypothetical protein
MKNGEPNATMNNYYVTFNCNESFNSNELLFAFFLEHPVHQTAAYCCDLNRIKVGMFLLFEFVLDFVLVKCNSHVFGNKLNCYMFI